MREMNGSSVKNPRGVSAATQAALASAWFQVALGAGILALDLVTGRYLLFPFLFVVPVALSAWRGHQRLAYSLAAVLPLGRLTIAALVEEPATAAFSVANAGVRIGVLAFVAFLIGRIVQLTSELRARVDTLVTVCAWSKTVEYRGEWLSFDDYLHRRFNIQITHGISPAEAKRLLADSQRRGP